MKQHGFLFVGLVVSCLIDLAAFAEESPLGLSTRSSTQSLQALVESVKGGVCKIAVRDKFGVTFGQGTGFLIEGGRIVSCHHVFADAASASVTFPGGQTCEVAGLLADDPAHDLAVAALKAVPAGIEKLSLAELEIPKLGTDVVALGYPLGLACTVSKGIITSLPTGADFNASVKIKMCPEDMRLVQTDAAISHGNSGGPLITMDGKVLAVIALQQSKGANLGFGIPTAYLRPMLASTTVVKPLAEVKAMAAGVSPFKAILPPRPKKVTLEEVMTSIRSLNSLINCKRCLGGGEVMVTTATGGTGRMSLQPMPYDFVSGGQSSTNKQKCPDCNGAGTIPTEMAGAYTFLATLAEPLVYLDTEATTVTPKQAVTLVTAIYKSVSAVSCDQIPSIVAAKAADTLRKATGETPLSVCFPGQIISKISAGDRDYLITRVIGADDLTVALVCKAANYKLNKSYLISGVIGGRMTTLDKSEKVVFVWPAIIMWPPSSTYTIFEVGDGYGILQRSKIPRGVFITSERLLEGAAQADFSRQADHIRLP